jgi:hypothetical protein
MSPQSIETRLEKLEQRVTILEQLPASIDGLTLQIVQLREEMHVALSASATSLEASLRKEIRAGDEKTRRVLREEFQDGFQQLRRGLKDVRDEVTAVSTKADELIGRARMLYEDMKATLALLREGRN